MKNNDTELNEHKGEVPVLITFAYHTKGTTTVNFVMNAYAPYQTR